MRRRFFVSGPLGAGPLRLSGPEAHHLIHVLRIAPGQQIVLFDGSGFEAVADVVATDAGAVELAVAQPQGAFSEPPVPVILASAVPKGERFAWLVEKATELGVARLVPLITERSVVVPGDGKLERMRRTVIESCKQCGRAQLMEISPPTRWAEFVARELAVHGGWVAHPGGEPPRRTPSVLSPPAGRGEERGAESAGPPLALVGAVGPEGGLTDAELELALAAGGTLVALGPRILRIETAGIVLAALLSDITSDR